MRFAISTSVCFCLFGELFSGTDGIFAVFGFFGDGLVEGFAGDRLPHLYGKRSAHVSIDLFFAPI